MEILTYPDIRLSRLARPASGVSRELLGQMFDLLQEHCGMGLAAPQVGIDARLFVTDWGEVFVNPVFHGKGTMVNSVEGCLSLPTEMYTIKRFSEIVFENGQTYRGRQAMVIQHEYDHLQGLLLKDLGTRLQ